MSVTVITRDSEVVRVSSIGLGNINVPVTFIDSTDIDDYGDLTGEIDGINSGLRKNIKIWSPYREGLSKSDLLKAGAKVLGDSIFKTWSCYSNKKYHCGVCESCNNRKIAFEKAGITDKTKYLK